MAVEWVKVATNVGVGGAAGAVDQLVHNADQKRIAEKPDLGMMSQYGTYLNYGVPILAVIGTALGFLKGEWATRAVLIGSQLAGRKVTERVTKAESAVPWTRNRALEATRAKQIAEAKALQARKQVGGDFSPIGIPVIADSAVIV